MSRQIRLQQAKVRILEGMLALTEGNWDKVKESYCEALNAQQLVLKHDPKTTEITDLLEYIFGRIKEYEKKSLPNRLQ